MDNLSNFNFNSSKTRKGIVKYVIIRNLPSNLVDEDEFEEMMRKLFILVFNIFHSNSPV